MQTVHIGIKGSGRDEILFNAPNIQEMLEGERERKGVGTKRITPPEEMDYRFKNGKPYIPFNFFTGMMANVGKQFVIKGNLTWQKRVNQAIRFEPYEIPLKFKEYEPLPAFVNQRGRGIVKIRPGYKGWGVDFRAVVDTSPNGITLDRFKEFFEFGGQFVGLGSYTPPHKGGYGTFEVVKWEIN